LLAHPERSSSPMAAELIMILALFMVYPPQEWIDGKTVV
jgi:hypothetical protein